MSGAQGPVAWALQACEQHGVNPTDLRLITHYSNAVVLIPHEHAVARVAIGRHDPEQIRRSLSITRWLRAHHGFSTVVPLGELDLVEVSPTVSVSFWEHLPQPDPPKTFDSADLARLLKQLHSIPPGPHNLAPWEPLTSLEEALSGESAEFLAEPERRWLTDQIAVIRGSFAGHEWPLGAGLIHGDAWLGNLLSAAPSPTLGDWDRVAYGPREVDLVPTWHATRRYGRDRSWTDRFVSQYGYDLSASPRFADLMTMRDLAQIPGPLRRAPHSDKHAGALRQRLGDLLAGDVSSSWVAL